MALEPRTLSADRRRVEVVHDLDGVRIPHGKNGELHRVAFNAQLFPLRGSRRPHVHGHLAVGFQARHDGPAERAHAQLALGGETLAVDELHEAARAVAALLHLAAVGVEDAVAEVAVAVARLDYEDLVAADAEVPVRDALELRARQAEWLLGCIDDHKIVARAVHLGERQLHASAKAVNRIWLPLPGGS